MSAPPSSSTSPTFTLLPTPPSFEYGEAVFHARRTAWLANRGPSLQPPHQVLEEQAQCEAVGRSGGSMSRLEALLSGRGENGEEDGGMLDEDGGVGEQAWRGGLEGVWRGLVGGRRLVKRMPLSLVIKVLKAGWQRDGTWPSSHPPIPSSPPLSSSPLQSIVNPYPPPANLPPPSPTAISSQPTLPPKIHPETLVRQPSPAGEMALDGGADGTTTQTTSASGGGGGTTEMTTPGGEGEEAGEEVVGIGLDFTGSGKSEIGKGKGKGNEKVQGSGSGSGCEGDLEAGSQTTPKNSEVGG